MKRRNFLKLSSLLSSSGCLPVKNVLASANNTFENVRNESENDRAYWVSLLEKIASPVLSNMSKGELQKNMDMQFSPTWDNRDKRVGYLEAFGRLIAGMVPWLALPDDNTDEGKLRKTLRQQVQQSLGHAVNPESPGYLYWGSQQQGQPLVDAAYIAQAFIAAPHILWNPLDETTKQRFVHEFKGLRVINPPENNWVLFAAMIESFLLSINEQFDAPRIDNAIDKIVKWYVGDGWYGDGERFHFDHYNGYVVQPMLIEVLKINIAKGRRDTKELELAYKRMQRYATFLERYISPEGTYLVVGRSSTYRAALFQPLVKLALENNLPDDIQPAQVRCALTAVLKRIFIPSTFTKNGWLQLGLIGDKQQNLADSYSNTGSMYITSLVFLPLGLPASHAFWSDSFTEWTQLKAWKGEPFKKDYAVNY